MSLAKYIVWSIVIALTLLLIAIFVVRQNPSLSQIGINAGIGISWISGLAAYAFIIMGIDKNIKKFFFFLMSGMGAKMIMGILSVLVVALFYKPMQKEYVFSFFISYFIFTAFEVLALVLKLRAVNQEGTNA